MTRARTHGPCVKVVMHFRDESEARAVLDAASLDDNRMWKITLERCGE